MGSDESPKARIKALTSTLSFSERSESFWGRSSDYLAKVPCQRHLQNRSIKLQDCTITQPLKALVATEALVSLVMITASE